MGLNQQLTLLAAERLPPEISFSFNPYAQDLKPMVERARTIGFRKRCSTCRWRSEEHTSELQSLMRISYAVFCLKKKKYKITTQERIKDTHQRQHSSLRT